jgi:hypothetical protein
LNGKICGSVPFYRLYHKVETDNFYTTSESERLEFITDGYTDTRESFGSCVYKMQAVTDTVVGMRWETYARDGELWSSLQGLSRAGTSGHLWTKQKQISDPETGFGWSSLAGMAAAVEVREVVPSLIAEYGTAFAVASFLSTPMTRSL